MLIAVYSDKPYERPFLNRAAQVSGHQLKYMGVRLTAETAALSAGAPAVAIFANDDASAPVLKSLASQGTTLLALRSAGFNHVDVAQADALGLTVLRVPAYSPYSIAEHTVGLMLTLNRKFHRAYARVREQNFALDGLMGFDMHGRTAGVVGTGKIGEIVCKILTGFGCTVVAFDPTVNPECTAMGVRYLPLSELYATSDIITLHCPLTPQTRHMIDSASLALTKRGVMLINTSRGAVVDTAALISALKRGHMGSVGLDVYEEEADLFFQDLSEQVIQDDVFVRLLSFPNVLITAHQGFFTHEAVTAIAETTVGNVTDFQRGAVKTQNQVTQKLIVPAGRAP